MRSADTSPEAERVQIELLRQAGPAKRFALACSLSQLVLDLARQGILEADPFASSSDQAVKLVEICYGAELAASFRGYLERHERTA
ncbi:MAG TPA: hypothetical protein VGK54_02300 [Chloroflexota bacterium]|jgi:hypothetical protein